MQQNSSDWICLDTQGTLTLSELSEVCGLSAAELGELLDYGALPRSTIEPQVNVFSTEWVSPLRTAVQLRQDYDLELFSVALLVGYLSPN
jgi:chaperone modulatory protein CbpM